MKNIWIISVFVIFMGCGNTSEKTEGEGQQINQAISKEDRLKEIQQLEEKLFGDKKNYDEAAAHKVVKEYVAFVDNYPDDQRSPQYLFRAGEVSIGLQRSIEAIKYFQRLEQEYETHEKVPDSRFLQAFVFDAHIKDVDRAKEAYERFLELHPNHELADDAKMSLQVLGKSEEELIKEFEAKQKANS